MVMKMKNLCAVGFGDSRQLDKIRNTMEDEFAVMKKEMYRILDEFTSNFELEKSFDNKSEERALIRKIDELKIYVNDLTKSCDSLYRVLKNFK